MYAGSTRQRGIALITVMLIVAVVATTAAYVSMAQTVWIRQAQNLNELTQAQAAMEGALAFALWGLDQDKDRNNDNLTEAWSMPLAAPLEGGAIAGVVTDAQGKFNLNNLGNSTANRIFTRLAQSQDLNPNELIDPIIDWLDNNANAQPNGAEDDYYLNSSGHYRAANQLLQSVDELRLIKGFGGVDNAALQKLRPLVTALPLPNAKININTAPPAVIAAMFNPPLAIAEAQRILAQRDIDGGHKGTPFGSCSDLQKLVPNAQFDAAEVCDVKSNFFEAEAIAKFGHLQYPVVALIQRGGQASGGNPQASHVLWQRYNVVKDISFAKKQ